MYEIDLHAIACGFTIQWPRSHLRYIQNCRLSLFLCCSFMWHMGETVLCYDPLVASFFSVTGAAHRLPSQLHNII